MDELLTLPLLREELKILPGPQDSDGSPGWTIHDPVNHKFLRLRHSGYELLKHWRCGDPGELLQRVRNENGIELNKEDLEQFIVFLAQNHLIRRDQPDAPLQMAEEEKQRVQKSLLGKVIHGYLFFRIPLVRPDRFLDATASRILPLMQWKIGLLVIILGIVGILMTLRQWDSFQSSFLHFFSFEGILYYGSALIFVKILHELGHAYTAKKFGCRVPTMGVAFLVMFPVLYTDTTDSWKLTSYRQRMLIGAAGMITELSIACLATFLWPFLEDGPVRSAVFILASLTWLTTLAVNLNPLMRFDGYYLLSDFLRVENMQGRAFELARWNLREKIFGLNISPPEILSRSMTLKLLIYAYSTWIYRFFLFIGIALLVYFFFFKALGIFLFFVEIIWFIALPVLSEIKNWWELREHMRFNKNMKRSIGIMLGLIALCIYPWRTSLYIPGILIADQTKQIYAPENAVIEEVLVKSGDRVVQGQVLAVLSNPELTYEQMISDRKIELFSTQMDRQYNDAGSRQDIPVIIQQLSAQRQYKQALIEKESRLTLRADMDGSVAHVGEDLTPSQWVNARQLLLQLVSPDVWVVESYLSESDLDRVKVGQIARFYSDEPDIAPVNLSLQSIDTVGNATLDYEYFSSDLGGAIAIQRDDQNRPVPTDGLYRLLLTPDPEAVFDVNRITMGTVRLEVEPESILSNAWDNALSVLLKESGF